MCCFNAIDYFVNFPLFLGKPFLYIIEMVFIEYNWIQVFYVSEYKDALHRWSACGGRCRAQVYGCIFFAWKDSNFHWLLWGITVVFKRASARKWWVSFLWVLILISLYRCFRCLIPRACAMLIFHHWLFLSAPIRICGTSFIIWSVYWTPQYKHSNY